MTDRPSLDVSSAEFTLHPHRDSPQSQYADANDPEALPVRRSGDNHSLKSRRSLRSFLSRKTSKSKNSMHEKGLQPISEEADDTLGENDDEFLTDIKEARLQDEGASTSATQQFKRNARRHKSIEHYTKQSKLVRCLRHLYDSLLSRTLITRSFVWWLPLALLLFIPLAVDAFGKRMLSLGKVRVMWLFIWLEVMWASLFVARQFAHYMPEILGFLVAIIAPRYFVVIDALIALEIPVTIFFWLFITFITFTPITATNPRAIIDNSGKQEWQTVVQNILVAFFLSGLFYLIEQLFIHTLSVSYHRTRMASRISLNNRCKSILSQLLYASWQYFPPGCPEFEDDDRVLASPLVASADNAGAKMKKVFGNKLDVAKHFKHATAALRTVIPSGYEGTQKQADRIIREALPNSTARQILAERIWKSLVLEGEDELSMDDIHDALGQDKSEDSLYIFDVLDLDGQGTIALDEMVSAVRGIGKETKHISRALRDMDGVITKLHYLLLLLLGFIVIIIFVGMVAPSAATVLATLGTTILGLSFIFSATAAEILSSCVFLFVKHPIDIGDIVMIDNGTLGHCRLAVQEINLLTTVFLDTSSTTIRQASNAVLNTLFIDNISRSPPQNVTVNLVLGLPETTFQQIEQLRSRFVEFLEEHPRDYSPGFFYQITDFPDLDRLNLCVSITMRNNSVDSELFSMRRTRFYEFISRCIHDIPLHIPRREAKNVDPAVPMYTEGIDHQNRKVERLRMGMTGPASDVQGLGRSSGVRRTSSSASHTGLRHRNMIKSFGEYTPSDRGDGGN